MRKFTVVFLLILSVVLFCGCNATTANPNPATPPDNGGNSQDQTDPGDEVIKPALPKVKIVNFDLTDLPFAIGVDVRKPELLKDINSVLETATSNGDFAAIAERYYDSSFENDRCLVSTNETSSTPRSADEQIVISVNAQSQPYEYAINTDLTGIDIEIAIYIADKLGKVPVFKNDVFDNVIPNIGTSPINADFCIMAFPTFIYEMYDNVSVTVPFYFANQVIIVREDNRTFDNCKSVKDVERILSRLNKKTKIGYTAKSMSEYFVLGNDGYGYDGLNNATVEGYKDAAAAIRDIQDGNLDMLIIDKTPASAMVSRANS